MSGVPRNDRSSVQTCPCTIDLGRFRTGHYKIRYKNKSQQTGYLLIELLIATALFGLASTALFTGVMQAVKAQEVLRQAQQAYFKQTGLWSRMESDFHNLVTLDEPIFRGRKDEISFPVLRQNAGQAPFAALVEYVNEDGTLVRNETNLRPVLGREKVLKRKVLKGVGSVQFFYPYRDEKDRLVLLPFWIDKPYDGPPRAVQIKVVMHKPEQVFEKWIEIPLGREGRMGGLGTRG